MNKSIHIEPLLLSRNVYLIIGILIVLAYYIPFFIFGENTYVHVHDILDIDVAHTKMLIDQHAISDYDKVLPIMDGIPRSEYLICYSPYDFKMLFYSIMPTFWAYLTNSIIVRLLAFIGMFLLLSHYVLEELNLDIVIISFVCAVIFSLIPFYTTYGLSSAGIPLLTWAFLNLRDKRHLIISYLCIALFANYSCLVLSGVFVCVIFGFYYLYLAIKNKDWQWYVFAGLCVIGFVYLLTNLDLFIHTVFNQDYLSQREDFNTAPLLGSLKADVKNLFFCTQYHSGLVYTKPIIYTIIIAIICQLKVDKRMILSLMAILCVFAIYVGARIIKTYISIPAVQAFNFERFYFFLPMLWVVSLAIAIENITNKINILLSLFLIMPIAMSLYDNNDELKSVVHQLKGKEPNRPTYRQFYDEQLFLQITNTLDVVPDKTKVVSIGLFPSIAEYNGYHTLDAYINIYPLEYKHKFRRVIAQELDKDERTRLYFDGWGNRCYMFASELRNMNDRFLIGKQNNIAISPDYDINGLRNLGCNYIFSAVKLNNYKELELEDCGMFTSEESYYCVYVYKVI